MRFPSRMRIFLGIWWSFTVRNPYMTLYFISFFCKYHCSTSCTFFFSQFLAKLDRSTIVCVFSSVSRKISSFAIFQGDHIPVHFSQKQKRKNTPQAHRSRIRRHVGMRWLSWYTFFCPYALLLGMCSICGARSPHGMRYHLSYAMRFRYVYLHGLPISEVQLLSFLFLPILVLVFTVKHVCELIIWIFSLSDILLLNWHYLSNAPKQKANLLTVSTINGIHDAS